MHVSLQFKQWNSGCENANAILTQQIFFFFCLFLMSLNCVLFSVFQIQTECSKQICRRPVLSAPPELNKHSIIDGHQALDLGVVFVAGECTHWLLRMGREVGSYTSGFVLFCLDDASNVQFSYFNCPQGPFHWRTLPSLSKTFTVLPHNCNISRSVFMLKR